jgi:hypothetical protein
MAPCLEGPLIQTFEAESATGEIAPAGIALPQLFDLVMDRGVAIIRGVAEPETLADLRRSVHAWGQSHEPLPAQTYVDENFHAIESGISPRQKTAHCYHAYNFNQIRSVDDAGLRARLLGLFERMSAFQNRLTGQDGAFEPNADGRMQRPQVIHYASGAGMFGRHVHPLEPQRIGLILGLSKRGEDFHSGGTGFEAGGRRYATEDCHDLGDLILFRYDIPHWVNAVDQGDKYDPSSDRGRWTAVLPFY